MESTRRLGKYIRARMKYSTTINERICEILDPEICNTQGIVIAGMNYLVGHTANTFNRINNYVKEKLEKRNAKEESDLAKRL